MTYAALVIAVLALLCAGLAVVTVWQVSKRKPPRPKPPNPDIYATWEALAEELPEGYVSREEFIDLNTRVESILAGAEERIDAAEVDKKIEAAIAALPKPSFPTPPATPVSTEIMQNLLAYLEEFSATVIGTLRAPIERELHELESRGREEKETLQQTRYDAERVLREAEREHKRLADMRMPDEPTAEMVLRHLQELGLDELDFEGRGAAKAAYEATYADERLDSAEKLDHAKRQVELAKEALEAARSAQTAFERDFRRSPEEEARLRELRKQISCFEKLSLSLSGLRRKLESASPGRSLPAIRRLPAPPPLPKMQEFEEVGEDELVDDELVDSDGDRDSVELSLDNLKKLSTMPPPPKCPKCDTQAAPGYKFCGRCGTKLPPAE